MDVEPKVAEAVLLEMLRHAKVTLLYDQRLARVTKKGDALASLTTSAGSDFEAAVFIDAT